MDVEEYERNSSARIIWGYSFENCWENERPDFRNQPQILLKGVDPKKPDKAKSNTHGNQEKDMKWWLSWIIFYIFNHKQ